ncbi:MAG: DUF192 domain-containing protein [Cyanobacteria bacterium J06632_22]
MTERWRLSLVALCLLLLSCSTPSDSVSVGEQPLEAVSTDSTESPVTSSENPSRSPSNSSSGVEVFGPGQLLPITAEADLAGATIQLEVAETRQQQALGLMYRTELADDRGMLFPFEFPRRASFWMKNVPISLDMIFLLDGQVQAIADNVPPCAVEPCPTYGPGSLLVDQVIELRGGRAAELGLEPGDQVEIRPL